MNDWVNPYQRYPMMNVLISTAIRENYGAHDWDGEGTCPSYWKNKGGEDYIITGVPSIEDAVHFVEYYICTMNDYMDESIVGSIAEVADDFRTDREIYHEDLAPVRISWADRFESKHVRREVLKMAA